MHAALGVDVLARTTDANELSQNLSDTATLLARIHDPDELLQAMAAKVAQAIGCDWAAVHLYDEASREMQRVAIHGSNEPAVGVPGRAGVVEWMERQFAGSPEGVLEISDVEAGEMRMSSCVSVPLRDESRLLGILTVGYRERRGRFARRQISLLKGLAQHAQVALVNAQLVRSLEEANRVKSDFVAAVSHDLRTPLHVLIGYNSMLLEDACGALNDEQRALVERMHECSVHFLDLINGVLGLGRVEAGFDRVVLTRVSLPQLADDIRREVEYLRRPEVELRLHAEPAVVSTDAAKLTTILRNLVTNALKFTLEGFVEVRLEVHDAKLRLLVRDTGPGIAPEERPKVFEMFRQGAAGLRAGGSGLGLGLYLVQRLSAMLGGTVELTSDDAGTTIFEVRLPLGTGAVP
jgi:signal transduction histidine kinase